MSADTLDRLRRLRDLASPGPWGVRKYAKGACSAVFGPTLRTILTAYDHESCDHRANAQQAALGREVLGLAEALQRHALHWHDLEHWPVGKVSFFDCNDIECGNAREALAALKQRMDELGIGVE